MLVGFEDTAELDLRVVVNLCAAELSALRAGTPISFALMAAHAVGVRCVLVCRDVDGAARRAAAEFPTGRLLTVSAAELDRLSEGRCATRVTPTREDSSVPFTLALAKLRPARPSRPMTTPAPAAPARSWRRGVRVAFGVSMSMVALLAVGDVEAVSIAAGLFVFAVTGWLVWDTWSRPDARPSASPVPSSARREPAQLSVGPEAHRKMDEIGPLPRIGTHGLRRPATASGPAGTEPRAYDVGHSARASLTG